MSRAEELFAAWLAELGFEGDPEMASTPERFTELLRDYVPDQPAPPLSTFAADGHAPVVLRDLPYHSLCAHHLLPFFGTAAIGYVPRERVAGFSGLARALQHFARRPQLQERLVEQLADHLVEALEPVGLVVHLAARQLCMEMRGARSPGQAVVRATRGDASTVVELLGD